MRTPVYLDSCAWNALFDAQVDMGDVFPPSEFALYITREVEIELLAIPETGALGNDNRALKEFIRATIALYAVRTTGVFGFATMNADGTYAKNQVFMGWDQGSWQSPEDSEWYSRPDVRAFLEGKPVRRSGIGHNQADASLGVLAGRALVVTNEKPSKSGPLRLAGLEGGHVIYLREAAESGMSLQDCIARAAERFRNGLVSPEGQP